MPKRAVIFITTYMGVEMGMRDGYVRILRTLPDNPARKAGILAGDIIYKIDGEEVWSLSSEEIAKKVRGESGTDVTVTVVRDGEELSFTMKRETINNVSAYIERDDSTAIITITRFDNDTGTLVQNFVKDFAIAWKWRWLCVGSTRFIKPMAR